MKEKIIRLWSWLKNTHWYVKLGLGLMIIGGVFWGYTQLSAAKNETTYQTAAVTKGTLVTSIAATGSISAGNTTNIATKASGTVKKVYVQNGESVKKGQKLLEVTLDSDGIERRSSAWQTYLLAQEEIISTTKDKQDTSIQIWEDKQAILDAEASWEEAKSNANLTDAEKHQIEEAVVQAKMAFEVNAAKLEHADQMIVAAKITAQAAYLDYQDVSGTIVSPAEGIVNNLTLTQGSTLVASTTQSTTTGSSYASSQIIGFVRAANNEYLAKVSLTEVDVIRVKAGQKVMITMDAHADKTFTGKVLAVDISGSSTSGVTAYPATIAMDATELPIYPNMTVSATIITSTITDVLLVNSTAVTTTNGVSSVLVMRDNIPERITIEIGETNDTQTVVTNGLSEGDVIVTGTANSTKNSNTSSAFDAGTTRNSMGGIGGGIPMGGPGL
ncbi:MAG: Periplasmic component of efflux system [uncultured bacterium]|nr:MAG: Periplasmic component of efflux system [uncultured bacterium]